MKKCSLGEMHIRISTLRFRIRSESVCFQIDQV
jgi:hypothetical protein